MRIANYRRDRTPFVNDLSLHPVFDSDGQYRYVIGVLADVAAAGPSEEAALGKVRAHLPKRLPAEQQPTKAPQEAWRHVRETDEQRRLHVGVMVKVRDPLSRDGARGQRARLALTRCAACPQFTRMLWSIDYDASLRQLLTQPAATAALNKWFAQVDP